LWKADISHALAAKTSGYTSVNDARRNTVWGDESVPNVLVHLPTNDDNQPVERGASLGRSMSTRKPCLLAEVPQGMDSARTSMITLLDTDRMLPPPSAASTVTLFDPVGEFDPPAQSTPYDVKKEHPYTRKYQVSALAHSQCPPNTKRSSIVYIKSSSEHARTPIDPKFERPSERNHVNESPHTPTQWSARAVGPLIPKSDTQRKDATDPAMKSGSLSLRSLAILKDHDSNTGDVASSRFSGTRPLFLGKKSRFVKERDENIAPRASSANKHLKPLQLSRTDSSKVRGMLRRDELLPSVVIRPPSDRIESIYEVR